MLIMEIGYKNGLQKKQCTWWANGRASQFLKENGSKYKKYPTTTGNGGDYWGINKQNKYFEYGSEPRANSLLCYAASSTMGGAGHVTYVEAVDPVNKKIYISHCSSGVRWNGIDVLEWDGKLWGQSPQGYIYLAPKTGSVKSESGKGYSKVYQSSQRTYKLYTQDRYSNVPYWNATVAKAGCGPTSAAIILSGYGKSDTPETVARSYAANGSCEGEKKFFTDRGLKCTYGSVDWNKVIEHLKKGNPLVMHIHSNNGISLNGARYTGHYITFLDYNESKKQIFVGDSGCDKGSGWQTVEYLKNSGAFLHAFYVSK